MDKKLYVILSVLILGLVFTIIVTPIESKIMNQELNWMYTLNLKEYLIFAFSLSLGIIIGKKLNLMALEKGSISPLPVPKPYSK